MAPFKALSKKLLAGDIATAKLSKFCKEHIPCSSQYNDNSVTYGCENRLCSEHGPLGNHHLRGLDERTLLCCKAQGFHSAALGPWGGGQQAITWWVGTGAPCSTLHFLTQTLHLDITLSLQTKHCTVLTCM